ncbi:pyridoxamine 5'-phosphate oxidase family protein [Halapricum sp. CBA1109]|uniref:pyridoxamine 5'-phosphate oxidase family protein n=1 Tax=Halapricum sp. CBA1109 TaxID=2668068 RepID=UPI0012FA0ADC|nr:pyridoxamine 5'-phosphate oxidase family protein [Halapricum sp. CBA1109]MUV89968.1 pyridoxamine 5'-phosphate oxidase family protein [Halapricum sp. CBA1109]
MGDDGEEMSTKAMAEFLDQQGDGVLSFGGNNPYSIPMAFGYDPTDHRCIFQFVFADESRKRDLLESNGRARLVTYDWSDPDDWTSVVVEGGLTPIGDDISEEATAAGVFGPRATAVPLSAFDESTAALEPEWYELRIEEMTGRSAESST